MRFFQRLFYVALLICISCSSIADRPNAAPKQLLADPGFLAGYEVMSPQRDIYTDRSKSEAIHSEKGQKRKPAWRLVQWGSAKSIAAAQALALPEGGLAWAAPINATQINTPTNTFVYKRVGISGLPATADQTWPRTLLLELNGRAEFASPFYTDKKRHKDKNNNYLASLDEYWPHLLMVQSLKTDKLSAYSAIMLSTDARLIFDEQNISDGYQPDRHAARFVVSIGVRNTLSNNSFWLNAVIYDSRYPQSGFLCKKCRSANGEDCYVPMSLADAGSWACPFDGQRWNRDTEKKGTRRMIFRIPTVALTSEDIRNGAWTHYQVDLLPYIKAGIAAAYGDKTLRGFHSSPEFYDLSLFSMGWEITGLNHAAMQVRNISLITQ